MSYGVMAYLVDRKEIAGYCGSKSAEVLERLRERTDLATISDSFGDDLDPDEALRRIVMGEVPARGAGHVYAYVLEAICAAEGNRLRNDAFYPCRPALFEALDAELERAGATLRTMSLAYGGPLYRIPSPDDFPSCGLVTFDVARDALPRMKTHAVAADLRPAWEQLADWCSQAVRIEGVYEDPTIVGYYY